MPRTIYFIPQLKEAVTIILLYLRHVFRILSKTMYFTTQQRTTAFAASFTEERSPFSLDPSLRAVINGVPFLVLNQLSINLLVVYRESVNLIGYLTRRLFADSLQL